MWRAQVLADLQARQMASAEAVSVLEDAVSRRRWWVEQWPAGVEYAAGLVAQDVQDALIDRNGRTGRWPSCPVCAGLDHPLHIHPELGGPHPVWVCEETGTTVAALGELDRRLAW